jgi:hypothetical protein
MYRTQVIRVQQLLNNIRNRGITVVKPNESLVCEGVEKWV